MGMAVSTMRSICHLLLCIFFAAGRSGAGSPESGSRPNNVVTLRARIFYDETVQSKVSVNGRQDEKEDPLKEVFKKTFEEVQTYFANNSVTIKISVVNVSMNNQLEVIFNDTASKVTIIDGPKTLEKLEERWNRRPRRNNTVFYLFTRNKILRKNPEADTPTVLHYLETPRTFCTSKASAAVLTFESGDKSYEFPARVTARILGSTREWGFHRSDKRYMNETLQKCRGTS
uniref:Putative secreted protein n=1 Tax=Amblyomma americanum TaxID=6943 RepID=A0A0C9S5E3_AMBAM